MPDTLGGRIVIRSKCTEQVVRVTLDNIRYFELLFGCPLPPVKMFVNWHTSLINEGRPAKEGDYFLSYVLNKETTVAFIEEISFDKMYELIKEEVVIQAPVIGGEGEHRT